MPGMEPMHQIIQRTAPPGAGQREIWLAGGCFWGTQQYLSRVRGVAATDVGYANGHTPHPTYEAVCANTTGYAETVRVAYDPAALSLPFLLELYFQSVDPTAVNRQGNDVGDQYRTGIYYVDEADLPAIRKSVDDLSAALGGAAAIEVGPLQSYYLAEAYHQDYLEKNPGGYCHIPPAKLALAGEAVEYRRADAAALRERLTPLQYSVTREGATEPPYDNAYHDHFAPGVYVDITTGQPLFVSADKFDSGCGWPAFSRPIRPEDIEERADTGHGIVRTEVRSKAGGAHLGHVFGDGPPERGGLRYCINSAALRFVPRDQMEAEGFGHLLPLAGERH